MTMVLREESETLTIADNLRFLMNQYGFSNVSELARQSGVVLPTLHKLLSGESESPRVATVQALAHFFGVPLEQIIGELDNPCQPTLSQGKLIKGLWTIIPILKWNELIDCRLNLNSLKKVQFREWVSTTRAISKNSFAIHSNVVSEVVFPVGSLLMVDMDRQYAHNNCVIVYGNDSEPSIKRVIVESGRFFLKPIIADFPPKLITESDVVLGVVVEARIDSF